MENGYGGPVWHASVAWQLPLTSPRLWPVTSLTREQQAGLWYAAESALHGVGDAAVEFREALEYSLHLKRRLTVAEWGDRLWGMDYRAEWEGRKRLDKVCRFYDDAIASQILSELAAR
jgi:hypothetical protein